MKFAREVFSLDIGTDAVRWFVPKRGLVVNEPNRLLVDRKSQEVMYFGSAALNQKTNTRRQLVCPFEHGVIADFAGAQEVLRKSFSLAWPRALLVKPDVLVTVAGVASQAEQRALIEALPAAKFHQIELIPAAQAAALGAGLATRDPQGCMVISIGAGTTEIALISLGEVVKSSSLKIGGNDFDRAIQTRLRRIMNLELSTDAAQQLKEEFANLSPHVKQDRLFRVNGTNGRTAKKQTIHNSLLVEAMEPLLSRIVAATRKVLESAPAELVGDLVGSGILMTGGSAQLAGLDDYLTKKLKVGCVVAAEPALCAVRGANVASTYWRDYVSYAHA